ncbi:RHS repeat protein [Geotalea daltonii FRC-32]|uniref:RHS repeat protein n=1 Tax=Geotalea daltonii (strain DSM 22248 / JCM 15807 / FRC-32) TaxID=316067 RepID=B9M2L6_GEODF|nr:RHS repeat-associated core domain-containing protein [Geotalea daltonii]ACM19395.1 RHS repeat protein [Geotalea daltonii FRC-32]
MLRWSKNFSHSFCFLLTITSLSVFPVCAHAGTDAKSADEAAIQALSAEGSDAGTNNPAYAGKPVSLNGGAETFQRTDLTLGNLLPISIKRRYNSKSGYDSPSGYGWAHNYDKRLYTYSDGSVVIRKETGWKRQFTPSGVGFITPVGETGILTINQDGSYTYTEKDGGKELYDPKGRLVKMTDPNGSYLILSYESATRFSLWGLLPWNINQTNPLKVAYDYHLSRIDEFTPSGTTTGAWVTFQYDTSTGRLTSISDSLGRNVTYGYDTIGNLASVVTPLSSAQYAYTDPTNKHLMTTVDEGDGPYANTYDKAGRVVRQTHGTGQIDIEYTVPRKTTKVTTTIKDGTGLLLNTNIRTVEFDDNGQVAKETDTLGNVTTYIRNQQTWITRKEQWENTGTIASPTLVLKAAINYTYDSIGNVLTSTQAPGTPQEKQAIYTYDPTFNHQTSESAASVVNPAISKITSHTYDSKGNRQSTTETGLLGDGTPYSYATTYENDANGRVTRIDGPRTDVQDVTTFTYDANGNMLTKTEALIGTTRYDNYDALGNPGTITDPNGNATTYTYDTAGRALFVKAPGDINPTEYTYTTGGCGSCGGSTNRIASIIQPEGNRIDYTYDTNGKLTKIADSQNNSINYSYDSEGNKLKEEIKDPSGILQKTISYQYDVINRLKQIKNPDATYTEFGYDALGNRTSSKDPKQNLTTSQYDALSRLTATIQPGNVTTGFTYDTNNNLTTVTDANSNSTTYKYDDLGRVYQTISPDTNTTTYSYDPAGNLKTKTDAKGIIIAYTYDDANRLTRTSFPTDPAITYSYDTCINGKGRVCTITDQSGTTTYEYTKKGQIAKETRTIDGIAYITQYTYDMNGNTKTIIYPSGRVITYSYSNDKPTTVSSTYAGITTTIANNISYKPFGGMTALTYGNGLARTITYDNQYRISTMITGTLQNLTYGYDANGNITAITNTLDNTKNKSYTYDSLDRLGSGTGPWGTITWTYDGVGNRQTQIDSSGTSSYSYQSGSNRLTGITGANPATFGYDTNGNTATENGKIYTYNQNQRLIQAAANETGSYSYNAQGQRTKKTVNGVTTYFIFDQQGQLLTESATNGTQAEYIYLSNQPLAKIDATGTNYVHTDHLGTPTMMTDAAATKVWEIEARPFGDSANITGTASLNLRFPGQYADSESGLNYNYFRDYNPGIGRYIQADPVGLDEGVTLFIYSGNDPILNEDPLGLWVKRCSRALGNKNKPKTSKYNPLRHDYLSVSGTFVGFQRGSNMLWSKGRVDVGKDKEEDNGKCHTTICSDDRFDKYVMAFVDYAPTYCIAANPDTIQHAAGARNCQTWADTVIKKAKENYRKNETCPKC